MKASIYCQNSFVLIAAAALFRQAIPELGIGRVVSAEFRHA
jgi:hypothetical protein